MMYSFFASVWISMWQFSRFRREVSEKNRHKHIDFYIQAFFMGKDEYEEWKNMKTFGGSKKENKYDFLVYELTRMQI